MSAAVLEDYTHRGREIRSEADLLEYVTLLASRRSVAWFHSYDARRDRQKGFPDVVLVGWGGVLFRELKGELTTVSAEQKEWGRKLQAAGADWAIWRPEDYQSGRIDREVAAIVRPERQAA